MNVFFEAFGSAAPHGSVLRLDCTTVGGGGKHGVAGQLAIPAQRVRRGRRPARRPRPRRTRTP